MLSHLIIPYQWVECSDGNSCDRSTHLNSGLVEDAPLEWVMEMLGNCKLTEWEFTWFDETGSFHREDGPAVENVFRKEWYQHGVLHRADGPAVVYPHGTEEWYQNGKKHRTDGPALTGHGSMSWFLDGVLHREDGPAVVDANGIKKWYSHGKLYRSEYKVLVHSQNDEKSTTRTTDGLILMRM